MSNQIPSEVHITHTSPLKPAISAWQYFLNDQGRSNFTIKSFGGDMQLLASFLAPDKTVGQVSTLDLNHFLDWLQKERGVPCSAKSLARRITSIKSFFRWLHKNGVITTDPAEKILQRTVISPLPQILTQEEQEKVIEAADSFRHTNSPDARPYTLLTLLMSTGIKKGECLGIHVNHVELDSPNGAILFVRYASPRNRYKERKISLPGDWVAVYNEYVAQYHPSDQVFPWSPRRLEYLLEEIGQKAGIAKHLSFDMCRWTCAVNDWKDGIEPEKIRQKLGVSKIQYREISMKLRQLAEK